MQKTMVQSGKAPGAVGPYSQAIAAGGFLFLSGQIPLSPDGTDHTHETIENQTRLILENMKALLEAGGCSMAHVVKTTVFLTNLADFAEMNKVYAQFFPQPYPARSTIQVAALPKNAKVEIEALAHP